MDVPYVLLCSGRLQKRGGEPDIAYDEADILKYHVTYSEPKP